MRLLQVGAVGAERPAVLVDDESYVDVSDVVERYDGDFLAGGGIDRIRPVFEDRIAAGAVQPLRGQRIDAPIARPHQILCIGLNYRDHAEETGQAIPDEPVLFTKAPNTLVGPYDTVLIPPGSTKTDWEIELGVVMEKRARYPMRRVTRSPAMWWSTTSASGRTSLSGAASGARASPARRSTPAGRGW